MNHSEKWCQTTDSILRFVNRTAESAPFRRNHLVRPWEIHGRNSTHRPLRIIFWWENPPFRSMILPVTWPFTSEISQRPAMFDYQSFKGQSHVILDFIYVHYMYNIYIYTYIYIYVCYVSSNSITSHFFVGYSHNYWWWYLPSFLSLSVSPPYHPAPFRAMATHGPWSDWRKQGLAAARWLEPCPRSNMYWVQPMYDGFNKLDRTIKIRFEMV